MKLSFSDLWCWNGTIQRLEYFVWGVVLFLVKSQIDRLVAYRLYHRTWSLWSYFIPAESGSVATIRGDERDFYAVMIAIALPFIWSGVVLTLRRLRAAQISTTLVVLFFVPVLNMVFFTLLCLVPDAQSESAEHPSESDAINSERDATPLLDRIVPRSTPGSALSGSLVTAAMTVISTILSTQLLGNYGWGLFIGLPFCLGLTSTLIYGYHEKRSLRSCLGVALLALAMSGGALLIFALEGAVCLLMALPLAVPLALAGAAVGYCLHLHRFAKPYADRVMLGVSLIIPAYMGAEHFSSPEPPLLKVVSTVDVDAPPDEVWKNVIAFPELPAPRDFLFQIGLAYPQRATITGRGPGALRHCVFSTGAFVEPIEIWDEPRLLKFSVTENPPPMQEWTIYPAIHPPHLHGFLVSKGGQFQLTSLPGKRTRLEGTTWYSHTMWPVTYWQLWSDQIIHAIHLRVLNHVKNLSEGHSVAAN
jgi:hypothetical protein